MKITPIINNAPYGDERPFNALRYATALLFDKEISVNVFLIADAVFCGLKDQTTLQGYYNIGRMISILIERKVRVCVCGTCLTARGVTQEKLLDGVEKSTMGQLVEWTKESNQVINF